MIILAICNGLAKLSGVYEGGDVVVALSMVSVQEWCLRRQNAGGERRFAPEKFTQARAFEAKSTPAATSTLAFRFL